MAKVNFKEEETKKIIEETMKGINEEDQGWKWKAKGIKENEVTMWWEYLKGEGSEGFTIEYDEDMEFFSVKNERGDDITMELEDNTDLYLTMRSVFWYATSRY